jgi:Na+-transporting NADH:ubiquinone oxidoreductase subunit NqrD
MANTIKTHIFWGDQNPLSTLTGGALLVMASCRVGFALVTMGALLWVYGFSSLILSLARSLLPRSGRSVILLFLSSLMGGLFILFLWFLNPLLCLGTSFFVILCAPCYTGSGVYDRINLGSPPEALSRSLKEALVLGLLIIGTALVREPLGQGSVSFPGGGLGLVILGAEGESGGPFPLRFLSVSAGACLFLGYGIALFRFIKSRNTSGGDYS